MIQTTYGKLSVKLIKKLNIWLPYCEFMKFKKIFILFFLGQLNKGKHFVTD